jgi:adenosylmethionine-8-amino-7-oxononanoate aminotransferase
MKMSLHSRKISGDEQRNVFFSLENSYHGETLGALSVSDVGIYRSPYSALLFDAHFLSPIPYLKSVDDPLWLDCEEHWKLIEEKLNPWSEKITAILIEPILQGAGGMKIYSQDFLKRLRRYTKERGIHLIADEIMTGMGRTGKMLACEYANIEPDFLCLSKGLTAGWLPLSAVLTHEEIYQLFYDDYANGKSFLHSHTYSGNALAASVALEVLTLFSEENILEQANHIGFIMYRHMQDIAYKTKKLTNVRSIGAMAAADLVCDPKRRAGYDIFRQAVELGALLRPLGNTIYWLPPLTTEVHVLNELKEITERAIVSTTFKERARNSPTTSISFDTHL